MYIINWLFLIYLNSGETFGHQRLWGSVGWGCTALTVGYMVDNASADKLLFDYSPAFKAMTILWILDILVIGKLSVSQIGTYRTKLRISGSTIFSLFFRFLVLLKACQLV